MSNNNQRHYYVLRTVNGKELQVKEYIEKEMKHTDLGQYVSDILIPMERTYQIRNGKKVSKDRPYYPGYVFVQAELVGEVQHRLRSTPNVLGFLEANPDPAPLRPSEVKRMLGVMDKLTEQEEEFDLEFFVGEKVKVAFGPFAGFFGEITEVQNEKKKLKLLVKVFGRETLMEVDFMQVEKEN
ncbi:transcription termination/antitermination protein NusG [Porphyromonas cangingivalis]|uniref:Transcription termination/antitermination protein NusG n=1 Tax=Porphyromonas cangingivalis TaxID=36874 RepID=A0A099X108_PORCN|nr:transcription termination/antitermination protein NusG [Porphyromonas cangingivalis]KGL50130.1 antitermination protein NusG [Porphyromonas cangingivalis]KGN82014.1 antitermination protein NusG [Porphyromonas cangingivalis]SJZ31850.1 transcription antitermination protein nusG [Porphyromonas cangingivalis]SPY35911.1 Transcription antitermination protein nusG [Porphyromonas cangingivalis]VEJ04527.1 Transcription antitermination protein nusG [Porphyromonas cangingivalis]